MFEPLTYVLASALIRDTETSLRDKPFLRTCIYFGLRGSRIVSVSKNISLADARPCHSMTARCDATRKFHREIISAPLDRHARASVPEFPIGKLLGTRFHGAKRLPAAHADTRAFRFSTLFLLYTRRFLLFQPERRKGPSTMHSTFCRSVRAAAALSGDDVHSYLPHGAPDPNPSPLLPPPPPSHLPAAQAKHSPVVEFK